MSDRPTLLLIDDEPSMGSLLQMSLGDRAAVIQAPTVSHALASARARRPSCVLLDLAIGAEDGLELAAALRAEPNLSGIPIVGFSVHREQRARALERLEGFIAKPFRPAELRDALEPFLRAGADMAAEQDPASRRAALGSRSISELERLLDQAQKRERVIGQQSAVYARELREIYEQHRAPVRERKEKTERIRAVIDEGTMEIVYQPIVDAWNGRILGHEALARFAAQPQRSPDLWFGEAAEIGLGAELELAAIRLAIPAISKAHDTSYVSVNLSPQTILDGGFESLIDGVDARRLVIEITEHAIVDDYAELADALHRARTAGVRLAVDDAGAGFASLRHILLLAPNVIKLDGPSRVGSIPTRRSAVWRRH